MSDISKNKSVKKIKARRAFVRIKALMPAVCVILMALMCCLPLYRMANDDTVRVYQSVFEIGSSSLSTSKATLNSTSSDRKAEDIALAKSLKYGAVALYAVFAFLLFIAVIYTVYAFAIWSAPDGSFKANLLKIRMKYIIPGKWLVMLCGILSILPVLFPNYVLNRFKNFYVVQEIEGTDPVYFEYSMSYNHFNPLLVMGVLIGIMLIIQLIGREWDGIYRLDLWRQFEPIPVSRKNRKRHGADALLYEEADVAETRNNEYTQSEESEECEDSDESDE